MFVNGITLGLTNNCNLACDYCFEGQKTKSAMPIEVAKSSIDWLLMDPTSGPGARLNVTFFGGEPLIEFEKIKKIVAYGQKQAGACNKVITFSITTNGTLLNEEIAQFWKSHGLHMLLSCDGIKPAHNFNRKTRGGKGSFELVARNFHHALESSQEKEVRMTVVPETSAYMLDGVKYLADQGFESIAVFYAEETDWSPEQLISHQEHFFELGEYWVKSIKDDRPLKLEPLERYLRYLLTSDFDLGSSPMCGAGRNYIGIGTDGTMYPCHRFASANGFKGLFPLGHVDKGFDDNARRLFLRINRQHLLGCDIDCDTCPARATCSGGCLAANYEVTGQLAMRPPTARYHEIIWRSVAESIVDHFRDTGQIEKLANRFDMDSCHEECGKPTTVEQ